MERSFLLSRDGLKINCTCVEPDYGQIRRVVLGVHGLCGSAQDAIQLSIAEEMELFGSVCLRFDFPAHGASPMGNPDFTLKNCVSSLMAVAEYAKEQYPQVEHLCIFATGFGAYVTLVSLYQLVELPGQVKLVIQTPSIRMDETLLSMKHISRETLRAMDRATFSTARPLEVSYSFYRELQENIALAAFPIPILIIQSEEDQYIQMGDVRNFHQLNEKSKLVIIPGTTHRFLEPGAWDMVLDLTRDWFQFEQVLLEDWD